MIITMIITMIIITIAILPSDRKSVFKIRNYDFVHVQSKLQKHVQLGLLNRVHIKHLGNELRAIRPNYFPAVRRATVAVSTI